MTEGQLKRLAQQIAQQTYTYLTSATSIDRVTALKAATDAGDEAAHAIERNIREAGLELTGKAT